MTTKMKHRKTIFSQLLRAAMMAVALVGLAGCENNEAGIDDINAHTSGILLHLNTLESNSVVVDSRAYNLNDLDENRVRNLYVFIFDSSGDKVYSQYYAGHNHKTSAAQVQNSGEDCWWVSNTSNVATQRTHGVINLHTTVDEEDTYQIYAITNLDADMVDISSDRLSQIQTEAELYAVKGRLIQQTPSRNGSLQMSGVLKEVSIVGNGNGGANITKGGSTATLELVHMDAKVHITLKQGPDVMSMSNAEIKIVNLPTVGYVLPYEVRLAQQGITADDTTTGYDAANTAEEFFTYDFTSFDELSQVTSAGRTESTYEAWFYMLENRQTPKALISSSHDAPFHERDRQTKHTELDENYGHNVVDANGMRDFVNANNLSTYVIIKCSIDMELIDDEAGNELGGDMQYIFHLGDFASDVNNYNTIRNNYYHYTITINGVHNVRLEVDAYDRPLDSNGYQPDETQPAASGSVVVAKEEIAICDCHYVSKTLTFHATNVDSDLTWYVSTPFGEGAPQIDIDGNDIIPPGLDYKWCGFRINKKDANGIYFEDQRQSYTPTPYDEATNPGGLMNVSQLVKYMKKQKALFDAGFDPTTGLSSLSDFDKDPAGPKICLTVFVDEFYYDYDPRDPDAEIPNDFWKNYINAPSDRYMYILSNSKISKDKDSRSTGSVVTIQQRPIQCIYDTSLSNTSFHTAWGVERTDEYASLWSYNEPAPTTKYQEPNVNPAENRGNNDPDNGRLNSLKEWNLYVNNSTIASGVKWDEFVLWEVENDVPQLQEEHRMLRYSCLTRNRDNNGNGNIDQDEIRWYTASIRQLVGMTIGQGLLKFDSRLYHRSSEERASMDNSVWRQHVVSSTMYGSNSNNPTVVWGEEFCSTGDLYNSWVWSNTGGNVGRVYQWTVRCVRNLGTQNETLPTGYDLTEQPESYVEYDTDEGSITCIRLDERALRDQSSIELPFSDENREVNRLSKKFFIAPTTVSQLPTLPSSYNHSMSWVNHNNYINDVGDSVTSGHCPAGYRLPNQNELTMILYYFPSYVNTGIPFCRTYYSFGTLGSGKEPKAGWGIQGGNIFMVDTHTVTPPRCVRDATLDELAADGLL